jgi:hypothetical protein
VQHFFPNLGRKKASRILNEIGEVNGDDEQITHVRRDRTNSDNWTDNLQFKTNEIKQEL